MPQKTHQQIFQYTIVFSLLAIGVFTACILFLNNGTFTYALDDPYIHLALAENIRQGHYGINLIENSAPASSIIWPFILAPFTGFSFSIYIPFILNSIFLLASLCVFYKIILLSFNNADQRSFFCLLLLPLFLLLSNAFGLLFTGMEHNLQVLLAALLAYLLIQESKDQLHHPWHLLVVIFLAAICRYENMALIVPSILYLLARKRVTLALMAAASCFIPLLLFSLFLHLKGLALLPSSVIVKGMQLLPFHKLQKMALTLTINTLYPKGLFLGFIAGLSFWYIQKNHKKYTVPFLLGLTLIASIILQWLAGNYGFIHYCRYSPYIAVFSLSLFVYVCAPLLTQQIARKGKKKTAFKFSFISVIASLDIIIITLCTPLSANNIYEQHYQLHRFVKDYYQQPIAVNDLGYVSYNNQHYILDLYGLGNYESFSSRMEHAVTTYKSLISANKAWPENQEWMNKAAAKHNVKLAIIYESWFKVPTQWEKVAEMHLSGRTYTAAGSTVSFYAINTTDEIKAEVRNTLNTFKESLPQGVQLNLL